MPVNDWTRVDAGIFHSFHTTWIAELNSALNRGVLPAGYYSLAEQHVGRAIADILTLHAGPEGFSSADRTPTGGPAGTLLAEAPPRARHHQTMRAHTAARLQRSIAVRHVSGHKLVAMIEIVSPANKDRSESVNEFVGKAVDLLFQGVHLFIVDLFPPGANDPLGIHDKINRQLSRTEEQYELPVDEPLTTASYVAGKDSGEEFDAYVDHFAVGAAIPDMPLFLKADRYVTVPLESTYAAAYAGVPSVWRDVLERGPSAAGPV